MPSDLAVRLDDRLIDEHHLHDCNGARVIKIEQHVHDYIASLLTSHLVGVARVGRHRQRRNQVKYRHILLPETKLLEKVEVCDTAEGHDPAEHVGVQERVVCAPLEGFVHASDLGQGPWGIKTQYSEASGLVMSGLGGSRRFTMLGARA